MFNNKDEVVADEDIKAAIIINNIHQQRQNPQQHQLEKEEEDEAEESDSEDEDEEIILWEEALV